MTRTPSIDSLIFKGTHNSYENVRHEPPWVQVDNYGVWAVEIDYSIPDAQRRAANPVWQAPDGTPRAVVGHDGPGQDGNGNTNAIYGGPNYLLSDYLTALANTEAFTYRPLLLYLEKKDALHPGLFGLPYRTDDTHPYQGSDAAYDGRDNALKLLTLVEGELTAAFPGRVFGPDNLADFHAENGRLPTAPELRGRVLAFAIAPAGFSTRLIFREGPGVPDDFHALRRGALAYGVGCGVPAELALDRVPVPGDTVAVYLSPIVDVPVNVTYPNTYRVNNFSSGWAWSYGVPPNPLIVDQDAAGGLVEVTACNDDEDNRVTGSSPPEGTRLLPYQDLGSALARVRGQTDRGMMGDAQRGYGFTILLSPGTYREKLVIDYPVVLLADPMKHARARPANAEAANIAGGRASERPAGATWSPSSGKGARRDTDDRNTNAG
jgi:hypothetical protein